MHLGAIVFTAAAVVATADPGATPFGGLNYLAPIFSTGVVGIFLLMLLFRIKIMPTYVYDDYKAERGREIEGYQKEIAELKESNAALRTLTEQQIIPALVRANQLSADYAADLAAERRRRHAASGE